MTVYKGVTEQLVMTASVISNDTCPIRSYLMTVYKGVKYVFVLSNDSL